MTQARLGRGYCIDTCALIDLWRRHYPPDVFPGLWEDIERLVNQGRLIAPREVLEELRGVDDEILEWALPSGRPVAEARGDRFYPFFVSLST
jgi:hypothetical protein